MALYMAFGRHWNFLALSNGVRNSVIFMYLSTGYFFHSMCFCFLVNCYCQTEWFAFLALSFGYHIENCIPNINRKTLHCECHLLHVCEMNILFFTTTKHDRDVVDHRKIHLNTTHRSIPRLHIFSPNQKLNKTVLHA